MAEQCFPFGSGSGASITDAQFRAYLSGIIGDGVKSGLTCAAGTGMQSNVATGNAFADGCYYNNDATKAVTHAASDPTNPRIDLIVIHINQTNATDAQGVNAFSGATIIKAGTPAGSPVAPTVTQTDGTAWEIALCQVRVPNGVVSSASFTYTDARSFAHADIPSGAITDAMLQTAKVSKAGDSMTGLLQFLVALSGATQLMDLEQAYGIWSDNTASTFSGGTTRLWVDAPNNGEVHIGPRAGANNLAGARFLAKVLRVDSGSTSWPQIDGIGASGNGWRVTGAGTIIARFQTGSTGLIVNNGFTFGSGGADLAERAWSDDTTLQAGEVVCFAEDEAHGGKLTRCTHPDCALACIISTQPSGVYGGELIDVSEPDGTVVQEYDNSPNWRPIAMIGRVPLKITGPIAYGQEVVSNGDGTARAKQDVDTHVLGVVCSLKSDVGKRALAPGCALVLLVR